MKRSLAMLIGCVLSVIAGSGRHPGHRQDELQGGPRDGRHHVDKILDTNKDILTTVEETLKAVTGDRGGEAGSLKDLAIGNGFSVSSVPSFDSLLQNGVAGFRRR